MPCSTAPRDSVPGSPTTGGPEAADSTKRFSPTWRRPGGVDEVGQLDLPDLLELGGAGAEDLDPPVAVDGDGEHIVVEGDLWLEASALVVGEDDVAVGVEGEVAGAGVGDAPAQVLVDGDLEEPVALDHDIEGLVGGDGGALVELDLGAADLDAQAHIEARGALVAVGVLDAGLGPLDIEQVLEVGAARLVPGGVGVGEVVGDDIEAGVEGLEPARGRLEGDGCHACLVLFSVPSGVSRRVRMC
jgi:hypothetical protein